MSGIKQGQWSNADYANATEYTEKASFTSEVSLLTGVPLQPFIPRHHFDGPEKAGRSYRLWVAGLISCTGTPTYTFQLRLGTVADPTDLTGASIGVTKAITLASGITSKPFSIDFHFNVSTPGQGTGGTTLIGFGWIDSPEAFSSPFKFPFEPTTPDTTTWTFTRDATLDYYLNLSVTSSASSASNKAKAKLLKFWSDN